MSKTRQLFIDAGQGLSIMVGLPTIPSWDMASRPKNPKKGTLGFNAQTNSLEFYRGKRGGKTAGQVLGKEAQNGVSAGDGFGWLAAPMSE